MLLYICGTTHIRGSINAEEMNGDVLRQDVVDELPVVCLQVFSLLLLTCNTTSNKQHQCKGSAKATTQVNVKMLGKIR